MSLRLLALFDPLVYIFPFLTILWSPHALWALALVYLGYLHLPAFRCPRKALRTPYVAGALLAVCLPLYVMYALYFCQVTMLHSDEGQYLRVTQSLLHDGDMDLANNLSIEQIQEFHVRDFAVHKAPGSPEGKVHSTHPIGLSVALVPAYWLGLEVWDNPRLATALFIALLASMCVPLLYIYLTRLGAEPWAAMATTGMMAITGPFFYYSNQIYPEIPAITIVLTTLIALAHWQTPGGAYRSLGRFEVPLLGMLTLLLCCLPFLHPRLGPLGLCGGALVLLQTWNSPRRWLALCLIGLVVAGSVLVLIAFHYAFSDDWLGPLRPGTGAWDENALDIAIWKISLPGHWLHVGRGILNTSPIYFFAVFGLLTLAWLRDRRLVVAAILFAATAGINGLHTLWVFGHDLPSRFVMSALPVLAIGLAWGIPPLLRRATTSFFLVLALAVSAESVLHTLTLPESGYKGLNLLGRSINRFYPFHLHFSEPGLQDLPLLDLGFWGLLVLALFFRAQHFGLRVAVIAVAGLAPLLWSRTDALTSRFEHSRSPYMTLLSSKTTPLRYTFGVPLRPVGKRISDPDGRLRAQPGHTPAGTFNFSPIYMPWVGVPHRGIYQLNFRGLRVNAPDGEISGYLTLSRRYTVPAVSRWSTTSNYALIAGKIDEETSLVFNIDSPRICYVHGLYTGKGELSLDGIQATFYPLPALPDPKISEIARIAPENREGPIHVVGQIKNLPKGHYLARFNLTGSTFTSFFERHPAPIKTAVYSLPPPALPLSQGAHPPWWLSIPFADDEACQLRFILDRTQDVHVLLQYDGGGDLDLTDIVLYRETFGHR